MEDREIIDMYFARDEAAIGCTAAKYGRRIRAAAYNILGNASDSEECENDTYLTAWKKIPPEIPNYLGAFLGRIARNLALCRYEYYSADKRNRSFETALSEISEILPHCMEHNEVEEQIEAKEAGEKISAFLRTKSCIKRVVFIRRYWYCDSIADIAKQCGFSESKVKSMLMRMRNELKSYLEREGLII